MHPTYLELTAACERSELVKELSKESIKQQILSETTGYTGRFNHDVAHGFHKMYPLLGTPDYEPNPEDSIAARAEKENRDPYEYAYDVLLANDGRGLIFFPLADFAEHTLDPTYERLNHHGAFWSLSDGGAHCRLICDASTSTFMLSHWTRDRTNGPKMKIEDAVKLMTHDTAEIYGLLGDRGTLEVGKRADINVIDYDNLSISAPEMAYDLPTGAPRLLQEASGYKATLVAGEIVRQNDEFTGARPGRLIRGRR